MIRAVHFQSRPDCVRRLLAATEGSSREELEFRNDLVLADLRLSADVSTRLLAARLEIIELPHRRPCHLHDPRQFLG
jgi:hypothetical protein